MQEALGFLLAAYLRLVQRTTRFRHEPADLDAAIAGETPLIVAMWHGQHLMISFAWPASIARMAALISRSVDGGAQASALRRLGVNPVRGSGGRQKRKSGKGGAPALRGLVRELDDGTLGRDDRRRRQARAGRRARRRHAGAHVGPADRADRGGDHGGGSTSSPGIAPASACRSATARSSSAISSTCRATRTTRRWRRRGVKVEQGLDAVHARAYAMVGSRDPGADLRRS